MKRRKMEYRDYICPVCGLRLTIPRPAGRLRGEGHVKHMFCVLCGLVTGFTEQNRHLPADGSNLPFTDL